MTKNIDIGHRLEKERRSIGLSQTEFAAIGDATRQTQSNYEKGSRFPDAAYLAAIAEAGADVQYIITGHRSRSVPAKRRTVVQGEPGVNEGPSHYPVHILEQDEEQELLALFRAMTPEIRSQLLKIAKALGEGG